jgi:transcriptional regulator with XRE-family HTH domain
MRTARRIARLSQARLGELIGLDKHSGSTRISRYENGIHEPQFRVATKIAECLGMPLAYFYCADEALASLILSIACNPKAKQAHLLAKMRKFLQEDKETGHSVKPSSSSVSSGNFDRRSNVDRRKHTDRRSQTDRRSTPDRRKDTLSSLKYSGNLERRSHTERRRGERRSLVDRRSAGRLVPSIPPLPGV